MRDTVTRQLTRLKDGFNGFTGGQKLVAVVGTLGLLLGGFMVVRWAATPNYSPLFANMSASDASAVIDELEADGIPYKLTNNGATVMVPRDQVYETRIALSGEGLPAGGGEGYSLLDEQSLSTSQFQEQTSFKRAMEGELSSTVQALDGVRTAVVRLALPAKQVFAKTQEQPTAAVLVETEHGVTMQPEQVQAVVHLVASSVEGLAPEKVTVADAAGKVLSADDQTTGAGASTRTQAVQEYEEEMTSKVQQTLDRVLGPGNSVVAVTANLDFDRTVRETTTYETDPDRPPLSRSEQRESYRGAAGPEGATGVVGPDGQMDPQGGGDNDSRYNKRSTTEDNAVDTVKEHRETAPGAVQSLHVGVALDVNAPVKVGAGQMRDLIAAAIGEDAERGDTIEVTPMPFDRSLEEQAAADLAAAREAEKRSATFDLVRNIALGAMAALLVVLAWLTGRRRAKAREDATTYVVEQLRADQAARVAPPVEPPAAMAVLESSEADEQEAMREELSALVERQPEEVAALLRGWLVEPPR